MVTCCTRNRSILVEVLSVTGFAGLIWLAGTLPASAAVVRFDVTSREPLGEQSFGTVGAYERIRGTVHYAIAPELRQNLPIVDLKLALKNAQGKVEFHADFDILTPRDPSRGNGAILYDVNNRGRRLALRFFNDGGEPPDVGHGFLMRHGFTVVWSGWDAEILPGENRPRLTAPVAAGPKGESLTGRIRCEMVASDATTRMIVTQWDNHRA